MPGESAFLRGRIKIKQDRAGYRFSIDSILLADFAKPGVKDDIIELGTGCGIIALILAFRFQNISLTGIEIQPELASLALENIRLNHMEDRINIIEDDIKSVDLCKKVRTKDMVISNPPYRKAGSGRINPCRQQAIARHELKATLKDLVRTSSRLIDPGGKLVMIFPAERSVELAASMSSEKIEPKRIRFVHSKKETPAGMVLVEGSKCARPGTIIEPPLIIYKNDNSYNKEVEKMFLP